MFASRRPIHLTRRALLRSASLATFAYPVRHLFAQPAAAIVHPPAGTLRGDSTEGVRIFRGIPFAQPPVGPLRFRPPVKLEPWKGERDATRFGASPMQWNENTAPGEPPFPHSENCLDLNIWAPEGKGPHPVFVWIHGGGFVSGHAFEPMYDGAAFARQGIVCVTVAYRLGVFGFLDFGPLLGDAYSGSANNALRDLIAALEWIQTNIHAFSGDPSRVTIGGESAGAKLADILMGIPAAEPLFHQVISEIGGAERVWSPPGSAAVSKGYDEEWRKETGRNTATLLTADPGLLIKAQHEFFENWPQHFPLRAEIDGQLLPRLPVETIAAGSTRNKRLLIGANLDESALFLGPHPAKDAAAKDLGNLSLAKFAAVFSKYKKIYPELSAEQLRIRAVTAEEYWIPTIRVADAHLQGGGGAWMYRLDFAETSGRLSGYAYHSLDVGLVWQHPHTDVANAAAEASLSTQIHTAWAAFIRGETPAAPGLPSWPEYNTALRTTMILNNTSRVEQEPQNDELKLWDGVL